MFVRLLGAVGAGKDAATVRVAPGAVAQATLAALALKGGRLVTLDQLADAVWDERPASWRNALHVAISRLREQLDPTLVTTVSGGYRLDAALARVDALEVDDLLAEARRLAQMPRWLEALSACESLLQLVADATLAGLSSEWAEGVRSQVAEQVIEARLIRARALVALARFPEAVDELFRLVPARPLDESVVVLLMEALAKAGRTPEALGVYDALRHRLDDELGVSPAPETEAAFLALLSPEPPQPFVPAQVIRLPRLLGPTFGRAEDVGKIVGLLAEGYPLVTIVGAGGLGKTRVAIAATREVAEEQSRSAWFIDLTRASDETEIAAALDAVIDPNSSDHKAVLATDSHLVVLDNAEHLVAAVAQVANGLLGCGDVLILVTSRVPLQIPTERVLWLSTLEHDSADSPAALLLADRAAVWFAMSASDEPVLAELAARVDGVPLALELLAAALRWQTPAELLTDLAGALQTPQPGGGRPERHVSVGAAIEWNLGQADQDTRAGLGALLVLLGDFPLAAAEAVLRAAVPGRSSRELLTLLIDLSLVQRIPGAGAIRLRILEPVRLAAAAHPSVPPADDAARTAYAHHFLDLAITAVKALDSSDVELVALHRLDDHNLTTALEWTWANDRAQALSRLGHVMYYWRLVGRVDVIEQWWALVLTEPTRDTPAGARCAIAAADAFIWCSRPERAAAPQDLLLPHLGALDHRWRFIWMIADADLHRLMEDFRGAEKVLTDGPRPQTPRETSILASLRGAIAAFAGDYERATELTDEVLRAGLAVDQLSLRVLHLTNRAYTALVSADLDRAEALLPEAVALARASGVRDDFLMANDNLAWLQLARGRTRQTLGTILASVESTPGTEDLLFTAETVLISALALETCGTRESCAKVVGLLRSLLADAPPALFDPWARSQVDALLRRWPGSQGSALRFEELAEELQCAARTDSHRRDVRR